MTDPGPVEASGERGAVGAAEGETRDGYRAPLADTHLTSGLGGPVRPRSGGVVSVGAYFRGGPCSRSHILKSPTSYMPFWFPTESR